VTKELVQLLIVADRELKMARDDTSLLVVTSSVSSQLKNFGRKVLEDRSKIDWSTGTNTESKSNSKIQSGRKNSRLDKQTVERSFLSSKDDEHDRRGKRDQPSKNDYKNVRKPKLREGGKIKDWNPKKKKKGKRSSECNHKIKIIQGNPTFERACC
jgi:hypothetical protein